MLVLAVAKRLGGMEAATKYRGTPKENPGFPGTYSFLSPHRNRESRQEAVIRGGGGGAAVGPNRACGAVGAARAAQAHRAAAP